MGLLRLLDGVTTPTQEIQKNSPKVVPNITQHLHRAVTLIWSVGAGTLQYTCLFGSLHVVQILAPHFH